MTSKRIAIQRVTDDQCEACLGLLNDVGEWLDSRGYRQRVANLSPETYAAWQLQSVNYAISYDSELAGIFSLPTEPFSDWPGISDPSTACWLRTLAIHPEYRGYGIGRVAVAHALSIAGRSNPLFLDCASQFLADYYQRLGFELLCTQTTRHPNQPDVTLYLLRHANTSPVQHKRSDVDID